jgi:hypothetical protein
MMLPNIVTIFGYMRRVNRGAFGTARQRRRGPISAGFGNDFGCRRWRAGAGYEK